MRRRFLIRAGSAALLILAPLGIARAQAPAKPTRSGAPAQAAPEPAGVSLLDALKAGSVAVSAEGTGDSKILIKVTNNTARKLKVVLPPGLIASSATAQMGGMGGMGGGMGGMGGGMGGMGGGMGGMGGGMGGMGGGMGGGGMGGGMGGGGASGGQRQLTLPATMGMMMLGRLIMTLVEPTESWNPASLMAGMGGMGGGMGGMGGGMGGMGGGMMGGGMGGGFRSLPPTDLPNAVLAPNQTRSLATRVVSLNAPTAEGAVNFPQKGEVLQVGDVSQLDSASPKYQAALRRLARDKAPENVSQVALWAAAGMSWDDVARFSKNWANAHELTLARQLVDNLDRDIPVETGRLLVEVSGKSDAQADLAAAIRAGLAGKAMLGLPLETSVPDRPAGPSIACKLQVAGTPEKPEAIVEVLTSDAQGAAWAPAGKFELPVALDDAGRPRLDGFADALAEGLLRRLVGVKLARARPAGKAKGQDGYSIRVENHSPLMLNGIALAGASAKPSESAKALLGIALSPRRALALPATAEAVERFGLKDGIKVLALDLSGL